MKRNLLSLTLIAVLICSLSVSAFAAAGDVTFTADGKLSDNFDIGEVFRGLEPGDSATYTVNIHNRNKSTTRWYMSNKVLQSLEDGYNISGGAYTYILTYTGPKNKSTTLYDSTDRANSYVGGEQRGTNVPVGLHEATSNLEEYFFLDTLNSGENGMVTLYVALEGETQDNSYQNTAAKIRMNFAVELSNPGSSSSSSSTRTAVKTGDENNLLPYYIGMVVAGLLLLYLALDAYTDRKYQKGRRRV